MIFPFLIPPTSSHWATVSPTRWSRCVCTAPHSRDFWEQLLQCCFRVEIDSSKGKALYEWLKITLELWGNQRTISVLFSHINFSHFGSASLIRNGNIYNALRFQLPSAPPKYSRIYAARIINRMAQNINHSSGSDHSHSQALRHVVHWSGNRFSHPPEQASNTPHESFLAPSAFVLPHQDTKCALSTLQKT